VKGKPKFDPRRGRRGHFFEVIAEGDPGEVVRRGKDSAQGEGKPISATLKGTRAGKKKLEAKVLYF